MFSLKHVNDNAFECEKTYLFCPLHVLNYKRSINVTKFMYIDFLSLINQAHKLSLEHLEKPECSHKCQCAWVK
jgi:hypothetical protein